MISSKTYFLKSVILIANIISVCIAILPSINTLAETTQTVISITVILIELFLLLVNNIHESNVDQDILGGSKKELVKKMSSQKYNELEESRAELRSGLEILFTTTILYWITIFFMKIIDLRWALIGGLVMIIAYIYADYVPHSQRYAKNYDQLFIAEDEKPSAVRGLGRIYLEEYQETKFCKKDNFYTEMAQILPYDQSSANPSETKKYLKCIFSNKIASTNNALAIISYTMLAVNILTVVPDLYNILANTFFNNVTVIDIRKTINICATIIFMFVSICQLYEYYNECYCMKKILYAINSDSLAEMLSVYRMIEKGHNGKLYTVRGAFDYSQKYIEDHHTIHGCPMKYRMKFPDKYLANISRYNSTYLLCSIIFFLFLPSYTDINSQLLIISSILVCIGFLIGKYVFLPQIGKRKIKRICKELDFIQNSQS